MKKKKIGVCLATGILMLLLFASTVFASTDNVLLYQLLTESVPPLTPEVKEKLAAPSDITPLNMSDMNSLLMDTSLQDEIGYRQLDSGGWLVAMTSDMPGVTPEMINWWFWWHAQDSLRYQAWFPGAHYAISYSAKDAAYFNSSYTGVFQPNTQYPVEKVGNMPTTPLFIQFERPTDFGFEENLLAENNIGAVVCGNVGLKVGNIQQTEMAHIFIKTNSGLKIVSRFWMGESIYCIDQPMSSPLNIVLNSRSFRASAITQNTAKSMAEHCSQEYRHLAEILPELYAEYGPKS